MKSVSPEFICITDKVIVSDTTAVDIPEINIMIVFFPWGTAVLRAYKRGLVVAYRRDELVFSFG